MTTSEGLIGVVVVNFLSSALINAHLGPVDPAHARVVIVDNWSTQTERVAVRRLARERGWTLVPMMDNRGFGAGVNAGVAEALRLGCMSLLLLNPDASCSTETAEQLRLATLQSPRALIAPRLVAPDGQVISAGSQLSLADGRVGRLRPTAESGDGRAGYVTWLTAACLAFHAELWQVVGGFDESFFMYWEDVDFSYRCVVEAGASVLLRDDLTAMHLQGATQGPRRGRAKSGLYYYYNCRNRLLFGSRHLRRRELLSWLVSSPVVDWEILMQGGRRQLLHSPGALWAAFAGGCAGVKLAVRALLHHSPSVVSS